jgi:hypothetical protein
VVKRRQGIIWRELDGKVVGLDLGSSRYFSLNSTGAFLWERLADEIAVSDLARALAAAHDLELGRAEADTAAFLAALEEEGLLE